MRSPSRLTAILAGVLLAAVVVLPGLPAAASPTQPAGPRAGAAAVTGRPGPGGAERITLITGDRVSYSHDPDGREQVAVEPAPRASRLPPYFEVHGDATGYYVIPSDVQPQLEADTLDRELFDVRELARAGLDDQSTRALPVIATYAGRPRAATLLGDARALPGSTPSVALPRLASVALRVDRSRAGDFWRAVRGGGAKAPGAQAPGAKAAGSVLGRGLRKLWLDAPMHASLADSVPRIGAPAVWQAGFDGHGVEVAVLDTGVDATHPDLAGKVAASKNFTPEPSAADGNGHGTHVASTIAGTSAASGGARKGVAPGASILSGKVLDNGGSGATSWILDGIDWAVRSGARVVNMSFGGGFTDGSDLLSQAVNSYTAADGVLFVVAAGNAGPNASTVTSPGTADAALTVGAVDKQDRMTSFSSRGPRLGDGAVKPEITAPGDGIIAARAAGTDLGQSEGGARARRRDPRDPVAQAAVARPVHLRDALELRAADGLDATQAGPPRDRLSRVLLGAACRRAARRAVHPAAGPGRRRQPGRLRRQGRRRQARPGHAEDPGHREPVRLPVPPVGEGDPKRQGRRCEGAAVPPRPARLGDLPADARPRRALPVLSLRYQEGQRLQELLDRGPVALQVDANPTLTSTYHLHFDHPEGIPAAAPSLVRRADLATVPMSLHGDRPNQLYSMAFFAHTELPTGGIIATSVWGPAEHTAYLGPTTDRYAWDRAIFTFDNGDRFVHQMESHDSYPTRGTYPAESWFAGPFVPGAYDMAPDQRARQFPTLCGFCREGDLFLPTGFDFDQERSHWTLAQPACSPATRNWSSGR